MASMENLKAVERNTLKTLVHSKKALYLKVRALGYYLPKYQSKCITVPWLLV